MEYIHANLDRDGVTPKAGSGWRVYLVTNVGPKWVRLLHVPDLTFLTLHRSEESRREYLSNKPGVADLEERLEITYDELWKAKNPPKVLSKDPRAIAEMIKRKCEERDKLEMDYARVAVAAVIAELEGKDAAEIAAAGPMPKAAPRLFDPSRPRAPGGNLEKAVEKLKAEAGATIDDLCSDTGWLPHSARAALTNLRGKGFNIVRDKEERGTVYRIKPNEEAAGDS